MLLDDVRPGITGWAQVNGYRGELTTLTMLKRVELDRWDISNWSMWLDITILFRTLIIGSSPANRLLGSVECPQSPGERRAGIAADRPSRLATVRFSSWIDRQRGMDESFEIRCL